MDSALSDERVSRIQLTEMLFTQNIPFDGYNRICDLRSLLADFTEQTEACSFVA